MSGSKQTNNSEPPQPAEGGLGWHVSLSIAFIVTTAGVVGWLTLQLSSSIGTEFCCRLVLQVAALFFLLFSIVLGGKGIQAASRYHSAGDQDRSLWLKKTRARFSYQVLLFVPAAVLWVLSVVVCSNAVESDDAGPQSKQQIQEIPSP